MPAIGPCQPALKWRIPLEKLIDTQAGNHLQFSHGTRAGKRTRVSTHIVVGMAARGCCKHVKDGTDAAPPEADAL